MFGAHTTCDRSLRDLLPLSPGLGDGLVHGRQKVQKRLFPLRSERRLGQHSDPGHGWVLRAVLVQSQRCVHCHAACCVHQQATPGLLNSPALWLHAMSLSVQVAVPSSGPAGASPMPAALFGADLYAMEDGVDYAYGDIPNKSAVMASAQACGDKCTKTTDCL